MSPASPARAAASLRRFLASHPAATGVALFALACATRLALIRTGRWTLDEIGEWTTARDLAAGKAFPLLGPDLSGGEAHLPGPLVYYVGAIPLLFSQAPEGCNAFVATLGGLTVVLYWDALRAYFSETGALVAAAMMACAPWSTLFADRLWNPNVVGLFVALAFWAACRLRRSPGLGAVVVLFVSMAATLQLHASAPMVWVALLPIWLPGVRRWRWTWPLVGMAAATLLFLPMLIHEHRTGWSNTLAFVREASKGASTDYRRVPLWAFRLMTLDVSPLQLKVYWWPHTEQELRQAILRGADAGAHMCPYKCVGRDADFHYGPVRLFFLALSVVFAAVALVAAGVRAWSGAGRRDSHPFFWAAVVGLAANTALLGVAHKDIQAHYIQMLLPFYFVAFAALADWAVSREWSWWSVVTAAVLVCIGGVDAAIWESSTLDGRNGLATYRRVISAVRAEDPAATRASISVDYRSLNADRLNQLTSLEKEHPLRFVTGNQYQLTLSDAPPPRGTRVVAVMGPVTLYRTQ